MTITACLSSKGQIVIPKSLRAQLALLPGTRFEIRAENGCLLLEPIQGQEFDMEALRRAVDKVAGCLYRPDTPVISADEEQQAIMNLLAEDDARIRRGEE